MHTIDTSALQLAEAAPAQRAASRPADDAASGGPGWFDSSWELRSGLDIREGWPADARLGDWLDAFLRPASPLSPRSLRAP